MIADAEGGGDPDDVRNCIRIPRSRYSEYKVSVRLPPEIYKREVGRMHEEMSGTLEMAVKVFTETLSENILTLAK